MIVDCHAHVFQHWAGACGHDSRALHLRYIQKNQTRPAAKVFRARDGLQVDATALSDQADPSWAGLKEVGFRVGIYGQLDFTVGGEDYYVQYMPVGMQEFRAPPELMLAQMTYAGVDHAILQAGGGYGAMNDYNAFAQSQYPEKFTALLNFDEPRADTEEVLQELGRAYHLMGLGGVYYGLDHFARHGFEAHFAERRFDVFWERLALWGLPVFIEMPAVPGYDEASYRANMVRLDDLLTRYPSLRFVLVMGPPVGFYARGEKYEFPEEVDRAYRRENLQLEIMYPISWGGVWDYPYPEAQALIRNLRERYGAAKLVWGSDMPNVERFCTYTQSLDYVRRYCDFLSAPEKDLILGGNMAELFRLKERRKRPGLR
jgi:predicted TIM-barrel fold metal-dependent hydrolase